MSSSAPPRSSGVVVPHRLPFHTRAAVGTASLALKILMRSWRIQIDNESRRLLQETSEPAIFALWHNRLGLAVGAAHIFLKLRSNRGLVAFVSASRDGGALTAALGNFGIQAVRGSSSRRGAQALLEAARWLEKGYDVAITPDGPRGPRYIAKPGVLGLAQVTGAPIIPLALSSSSVFEFKSWDRFQVGYPLARTRLRFGPLLKVPESEDEVSRERRLAELAQHLNRPV